MRKNKYKNKYDITIIGGGLTGKLMLSLLQSCNLFDENKLCWINTDNENSKDIRVSFINYKNFVQLDMFKSKTGRLTSKKGSFPVLNLKKEFRKVLKPNNDLFVFNLSIKLVSIVQL